MMAAKDCIKKARLSLGLSQSELAKEIGLSKQAICHYELGKNFPHPKTIRKIVNYMKDNNIDMKYEDLMED